MYTTPFEHFSKVLEAITRVDGEGADKRYLSTRHDSQESRGCILVCWWPRESATAKDSALMNGALTFDHRNR